MTTMIVLWAIVACVLVPLIQRDLRKAVKRQQRRRIEVAIRGRDTTWFREVGAGMVRVRLEIQDNFTPALQKAAAAIAEFSNKLPRDMP